MALVLCDSGHVKKLMHQNAHIFVDSQKPSMKFTVCISGDMADEISTFKDIERGSSVQSRLKVQGHCSTCGLRSFILSPCATLHKMGNSIIDPNSIFTSLSSSQRE